MVQWSSKLAVESLEQRHLLAADVAISLDGPATSVESGSEVSYTFVVANAGNAPVALATVKHEVATGVESLRWERSRRWPAKIDLAEWGAPGTLRIDGGLPNGLLGDGLSSGGDVNADGFDDVLIGASGRAGIDPAIGHLYLLFGSASLEGNKELPPAEASVAQTLVQTDIPAQNASTTKMAGGADFNGDGFVDILLAAPGADAEDFRAGEVFLLYGSETAFSEDFDFLALDGQNGTRILGVAPGDIAGSSVGNAGDVNGDGLDDLIIGAPGSNTGSIDGAGEAYVVFGALGGLGSDFDLANLDGANGFTISGSNENERVGTRVSRAGDINGDGFGDVIVASATSRSYVVLGSGQPFDRQIDLQDASEDVWFSVNAGERSIESIGAVGDINADGLDDMAFGVPAPRTFSAGGTAYVVFGRAARFSAVELSELDGKDGFAVVGTQLNDQLGTAVAGIDVNGDQIHDLVLGAPRAVGGGPSSSFSAGEVYVLFGSDQGFPAEFSTDQLGGDNGFVIHGIGATSNTGETLSNAGDVNGDGVDDLIVAAPMISAAGGFEGQAYVVFGDNREVGAGAIDDSLTLGPGESVQYEIVASIPNGPTRPLQFSASVTLPEGQADDNMSDNAIEWTMRSPSPLLGDIDFDDQVTFADYLVLSANFGRMTAPSTDGDLDGDAIVGFADFLLFAQVFDGSAAMRTVQRPR